MDANRGNPIPIPPVSGRRRIKNAYDEVYESMEGERDSCRALFDMLFGAVVTAQTTNTQKYVGILDTKTYGKLSVFQVTPLNKSDADAMVIKVIGHISTQDMMDTSNSVLISIPDRSVVIPQGRPNAGRVYIERVPLCLIRSRGMWIFASAWNSRIMHELGDGGFIAGSRPGT